MSTFINRYQHSFVLQLMLISVHECWSSLTVVDIRLRIKRNEELQGEVCNDKGNNIVLLLKDRTGMERCWEQSGVGSITHQSHMQPKISSDFSSPISSKYGPSSLYSWPLTKLKKEVCKKKKNVLKSKKSITYSKIYFYFVFLNKIKYIPSYRYVLGEHAGSLSCLKGPISCVF